MKSILTKQALTTTVLLLSTALPSISHATPCPPGPRKYTPTMEHQIGDVYAAYATGLDAETLIARIDALTLAYHNKHPSQSIKDPDESSENEDVFMVPSVPNPDFLDWFVPAKTSSIPPGHFQNVTIDFHEESETLHPKCTGSEEFCHWAWGVNPKHNDFNAGYFRSGTIAKNLRCRPEGVTLIGYVLPPGGSKDEEKRKDDRFLVTITDLKPAHLDFLRELKAKTLDYLTRKFGYEPQSGDSAQLYFHWPTGLRTSVLHLHAKINFSMSPPESLRGFTIDEVIHALEEQQAGNKFYARGVTSLIANRWGAVGSILLEQSEKDDEKFWSILNGVDLTTGRPKLPTQRDKYFKWITDYVKTGWYDPSSKKLTLQVSKDANKEMKTTALITSDLTTNYDDIKGQLPAEVQARTSPLVGGATLPSTFYGVVQCLYPAALGLYHPTEKDDFHIYRCLHFKSSEGKVGARLTTTPGPIE